MGESRDSEMNTGFGRRMGENGRTPHFVHGNRTTRLFPRQTNRTRITVCSRIGNWLFSGYYYRVENSPIQTNRFKHFPLYFGEHGAQLSARSPDSHIRQDRSLLGQNLAHDGRRNSSCTHRPDMGRPSHAPGHSAARRRPTIEITVLRDGAHQPGARLDKTSQAGIAQSAEHEASILGVTRSNRVACSYFNGEAKS